MLNILKLTRKCQVIQFLNEEMKQVSCFNLYYLVSSGIFIPVNSIYPGY